MPTVFGGGLDFSLKTPRRSDMYISTLSKIIEAMGGELQIIANMPNGRVQIRQFTKIRKK